MTPEKPKLYVSLDGPILIPGNNPHPMLGAEISPYAQSFMRWATRHFDVRWLTDRNPRDAFQVARVLGLPEDAVPVHTFHTTKVPALERHHNFYLVDSELIPHEVSWFTEHNKLHRLNQVDPMVGVTPDTKKYLEAALTHKRPAPNGR